MVETRKLSRYALLIGMLLSSSIALYSDQKADAPVSVTEGHVPSQASTKKTHPVVQEKVRFVFDKKPLAEVVSIIANKMGKNLMLPQGASTMSATLTVSMAELLTIDQAWDRVLMMLGIAGYTVVPDGELLMVIKTDASANKQQLPLYINTPLRDLPPSEERIRYIYYLQHIAVPNGQGASNSLSTILKDILSAQTSLLWDYQSNGLVITDRASAIRAAMELVQSLDTANFGDDVEMITLQYTSAQVVSSFCTELIKSAEQIRTTTGSVTYFSDKLKVVPDPRSNSVILMGRKASLDRLSEFVRTYVDVPQNEGDSLLHVYDLQYLDAQQFSSILKSIVSSGGSSSGGQSSSSGGDTQSFQDVIITYEAVSSPQSQSSDGSSSVSGVMQGSNRLIVAARQRDWVRIRDLIEKLDQPQLQVAIEVLVVDIVYEGVDLLGSKIRNKAGEPTPDGVNFQTAHLGGNGSNGAGLIQLKGTAPDYPPDALAANLLQLLNGNNIANTAAGGSAVLSFQDTAISGIWWVLQILNKYTKSKIISQPFVVTANNQAAYIEDSQIRFLQGPVQMSSGTIPVINFENVTAKLSVKILPTISFVDQKDNNINLAVEVSIEDFLSEASNRVSRNVVTNANIKNGEVLVLGGLIKTSEDTEELLTPPFCYIPVLGQLFKKKQLIKTKNNLVVFISAQVIAPGVNRTGSWTVNHLGTACERMRSNNMYAQERDPISRWMFGAKRPKPGSIFKLPTNVFDRHILCEATCNIECPNPCLPVCEPTCPVVCDPVCVPECEPCCPPQEPAPCVTTCSPCAVLNADMRTSLALDGRPETSDDAERIMEIESGAAMPTPDEEPAMLASDVRLEKLPQDLAEIKLGKDVKLPTIHPGGQIRPQTNRTREDDLADQLKALLSGAPDPLEKPRIDELKKEMAVVAAAA